MSRRAWIGAAVALLMQSCAGPGTTQCANGRICPRGTVCADAHDRCVLESQVSACDGLTEGAACGFADVDVGECAEGVCFQVACGNQIQQAAEMCDDGNRADGDGCNAQCTSDETCGNGFLDASRGEVCDGPIPANGATCVDTFYADHGRLTCLDDCMADFGVCAFFGWRTAAFPEIPGPLSDVWRGSDVVFAVGVAGSIVRAEAGNWQTVESGTDAWLRSVWGSASDRVIAVGDGGTILRFDGTSWGPMASGTAVGLYAVWGSAADDVYAVGEGGTILHFDGDTWSGMASPTSERLRGVWGAGAGDVYAVGDAGTIIHLESGTWSPMVSGTTAGLADVWGSGADSLFAVGDGGTILHHDGVDWSPSPSNTTEPLAGVWGLGADQVFAVGGESTILAYDGVGWSRLLLSSLEPLPGESQPAFHSISGVDGGDASDLVVVGDSGMLIEHTGSSWAVWPRVTTESLHGMWSPGGRDVFAFGSAGTILRRDGSTWSVTQVGAEDGLTFMDAWGTGPDNVFAVADFLSVLIRPTAAGPVSGPPPSIYHFDGATWTAMESGVDMGLLSVWGSGPTDVFAVGAGGTIVHFDGLGWTPMDSGITDWLTAVWGSGPDDVYAVGDNGRILHYDGIGWTPMEVAGIEYDDTGFAPVFFLDVWGSGPDDVFALAAGQIYHHDGSGWSHVDIQEDQVLEDIVGTGPDDVFAVGRQNRVLHYDGVSWAPLRVHSEPGGDPQISWTSLWATPDGIFIGSDTGVLTELHRFQPW